MGKKRNTNSFNPCFFSPLLPFFFSNADFLWFFFSSFFQALRGAWGIFFLRFVICTQGENRCALLVNGKKINPLPFLSQRKLKQKFTTQQSRLKLFLLGANESFFPKPTRPNHLFFKLFFHQQKFAASNFSPGFFFDLSPL